MWMVGVCLATGNSNFDSGALPDEPEKVEAGVKETEDKWH